MVSSLEKSDPVVIANKGFRLGLFGARADDGGLGNETFEFFRYMQPDKTLIVDISKLTNKPNNFNRYDIATNAQYVTVTDGFPGNKHIHSFLEGLDIVICYETPYNYDLFRIAKQKGIKTVLRYNYEFLDYLNQPNLPFPDVLASPSLWHLNEVVEQFSEQSQILFLLNPIARDRLPFREIHRIETFIHVAGTELFEDRNGTNIVLSSLAHIKSDIKLKVLSQHPINTSGLSIPPNIELSIEGNKPDYWNLYEEGDCLLLPRRYGGQTLQLNEAMSTGMIPLMLDIEPQNAFLDPICLVPTSSTKKILTRTEIDCYDADPIEYARKIDILAHLNREEVFKLNLESDLYAESLSWRHMKSYYYEFLGNICMSQL